MKKIVLWFTFLWWLADRGLQRDVVYLGWPIAPSYMSSNAEGGRELRGLSTKYVHIKSTTVYALRRNWDSPNPFLASESSPPPRNRGEGHTSLRVGGWGESQFRRGAYTVVLFICTYFVGLSQWVQLYTGAQITFGDLTPYLTYIRRAPRVSSSSCCAVQNREKSVRVVLPRDILYKGCIVQGKPFRRHLGLSISLDPCQLSKRSRLGAQFS